MKKYGKFLLAFLILALIISFFVFDLSRFFSLAYIKSQQDIYQQWYAEHTFLTVLIFALIYIANVALSLPTAALMTLLAGALFGVWVGTLVVSFASTIGATLAFLAARFILRDWVQANFSNRLEKVNQGIEKEGAFYLFTLRLIPVVPFFALNLVMGLTPMRTLTYYWVSQLGMLPGTFVYVNAGTQLSQIDRLSGILSLDLLLSFCLLGIFPFATKKIMEKVRKKKGASTDV